MKPEKYCGCVLHSRKVGNSSWREPHGEAFTFGDPVPVLDRRELLDYVECVVMDKWYEPPVSFDGLARPFRAAVHHSSPIAVKRNILTSTFIPHPLLSQQAFNRFVQDYLVFGNAYLEKRTTGLGGVLSLEPALAKLPDAEPI